LTDDLRVFAVGAHEFRWPHDARSSKFLGEPPRLTQCVTLKIRSGLVILAVRTGEIFLEMSARGALRA
jgi:hypothetical protein